MDIDHKPVKLIIQLPNNSEAQTLPATIQALPHPLPGSDTTEEGSFGFAGVFGVGTPKTPEEYHKMRADG